jgi:hypothetical protein
MVHIDDLLYIVLEEWRLAATHRAQELSALFSSCAEFSWRDILDWCAHVRPGCVTDNAWICRGS